MKPHRSFLTAAFFFFLFFSHLSLLWAEPLPTAAPEKVGLASQQLDRIGVILKEDIAAGKIPGAVVLVARRGKIAYFESFGMRDPAAGAPMGKDTIFRLYSMTKPLISAGIMILGEDRDLMRNMVYRTIRNSTGGKE